MRAVQEGFEHSADPSFNWEIYAIFNYGRLFIDCERHTLCTGDPGKFLGIPMGNLWPCTRDPSRILGIIMGNLLFRKGDPNKTLGGS